MLYFIALDLQKACFGNTKVNNIVFLPQQLRKRFSKNNQQNKKLRVKFYT